MTCEYGERYLQLLKEHPAWGTKQHAEALGMEWNKCTMAKLSKYRRTHSKEIVELLGEPIDSDEPEICEKAREELLAMTDEEREEYRAQCKGYELRKARAEKDKLFKRIATLEGEAERLENELNEANETIARLTAELESRNADNRAETCIEKLLEEAEGYMAEIAQLRDELTRVKLFIADAFISKRGILE